MFLSYWHALQSLRFAHGYFLTSFQFKVPNPIPSIDIRLVGSALVLLGIRFHIFLSLSVIPTARKSICHLGGGTPNSYVIHSLSEVSSIRTGVSITATSQSKIQVPEYRSQNGDKSSIQKTEANIRTIAVYFLSLIPCRPFCFPFF